MPALVPEDLALVRRMLGGEERAFEEFFARYFSPLFRFARARLRGEEDAAEEVVQEVLILAVRKLATYRGEATLLTWLFTLCRHRIGAQLRARRRGEMEELIEERPDVRSALESLGGGDLRSELQRRETGRLVRFTLDSLPDRYRDALEWKYLLGLSVLEIAERLGVSGKAAESLLGRARLAFRDGFSTVTAELAEQRGATR
jgi:RNA polymerase sigma-70 factor, ECF subfamily